MDIKINQDGLRFKYRVCGLVTYDDKYLIVNHTGNEHFNLPGGHAEIGESSLTSLRREMLEETCMETKDEKLFCVCENFYSKGLFHELGFYYVCKLKKAPDFLGEKKITEIDKGKEKVLLFKWVTKEQLKEINLLPIAIKDLIIKGKLEELSHIINANE